jgi:hypothetical protein
MSRDTKSAGQGNNVYCAEGAWEMEGQERKNDERVSGSGR